MAVQKNRTYDSSAFSLKMVNFAQERQIGGFYCSSKRILRDFCYFFYSNPQKWGTEVARMRQVYFLPNTVFLTIFDKLTGKMLKCLPNCQPHFIFRQMSNSTQIASYHIRQIEGIIRFARSTTMLVDDSFGSCCSV